MSDHAPDHGVPAGTGTNADRRLCVRSATCPTTDGWFGGSTSADEVRSYYDDQAATYDTTLDSWGYDAPANVARLVMGALDGPATV